MIIRLMFLTYFVNECTIVTKSETYFDKQIETILRMTIAPFYRSILEMDDNGVGKREQL
jgi:hypothetical protein